MIQKNIIDDIKYIYNQEAFSTAFRPERAYSAIENFDCFVRPGKNTHMLMQEFAIALRQSEELVEKMKRAYGMIGFPFHYEHTLWVMTAVRFVLLVKKYFDNDFFEATVKGSMDLKRRNKEPFFTYLEKNATQHKRYMFVRNYPLRALRFTRQ